MAKTPRVSAVSVKDLKNQPISVVKTEVPALAKALGVPTDELFRTISGAQGSEAASGDCRCCGNDSW